MPALPLIKAVLASSSRVRLTISLHDEYLRARAREDLRYDLCRLFSSSAPGCACSLTQCGSNNSLGSLPHTDSDWLVRVGLDNARISSRISASRSGGSGDMLIYVRDAADLKLCLPLYPFFACEVGNPHCSRARQLNPCCTPDLFLPPISITRVRVSKRKAGRRSPSS